MGYRLSEDDCQSMVAQFASQLAQYKDIYYDRTVEILIGADFYRASEPYIGYSRDARLSCPSIRPFVCLSVTRRH